MEPGYLPSRRDTRPVSSPPPKIQDHGKPRDVFFRGDVPGPRLHPVLRRPLHGSTHLLLHPAGEGQLQAECVLKYQNTQPHHAHQHALRETRPHGPQLGHHQEGSLRHPRHDVTKTDFSQQFSLIQQVSKIFNPINPFPCLDTNVLVLNIYEDDIPKSQPSTDKAQLIHTLGPFSSQPATSGLVQGARVGQLEHHPSSTSLILTSS